MLSKLWQLEQLLCKHNEFNKVKCWFWHLGHNNQMHSIGLRKSCRKFAQQISIRNHKIESPGSLGPCSLPWAACAIPVPCPSVLPLGQNLSLTPLTLLNAAPHHSIHIFSTLLSLTEIYCKNLHFITIKSNRVNYPQHSKRGTYAGPKSHPGSLEATQPGAKMWWNSHTRKFRCFSFIPNPHPPSIPCSRQLCSGSSDSAISGPAGLMPISAVLLFGMSPGQGGPRLVWPRLQSRELQTGKGSGLLSYPEWSEHITSSTS